MANYQQMAIADANAAGINSSIFVKQIQAESGFNPNAASSAGAIGIAQFLPSTAAGMGVNPWDPVSALQGAARLDAQNLKAYGGDYKKMLAAYNAGGGTVNSAIARGGSNWLAYMPTETQKYVSNIMSGSNVPSSGKTVAVSSPSSDLYQKGQCTYWASERYHQLAGYYASNSWGNAQTWAANAKSTQGWVVSSKPIAPSIICLQANVQGASSQGHVAVVEKVNTDGSVYTSNMNWGLSAAARAQVSHWPFKPGPGVSFIWAGAAAPAASLIASSGFQLGSFQLGVGPATFVSLLDQVHQTLIETPGFYGIALAIDEAEQFPGFINLTDPSSNVFGVNYDVVGYIRSVGATVSDNLVPVVIRGDLILLGMVIIILLVAKIALDLGKDVLPIVGAMIK